MEHLPTIDEKLAEYGLKIRHSDDKDRELIDLSIEDGEDNVAWLWGSDPYHDIEWECNHPAIKYGDDDERGECVLCGSWCDWHWEKEVVNEGEDNDGNHYCQEGDVRVPHEWYPRQTAGGILGEIIEYYKRTF